MLDIDPRHGGAESIAALPELPATRESVTGGGGRHLFLRVPQGVRVGCSAGRLGSGLDVRGEGGYIVAPPSVHESGRRYQWREGRGLDFPMAEAPRWLLERLRDRPRTVARPRVTVPVDFERRARRARRYVAACPPAISGSGGHAATWRVACALVLGFALPEDLALAILAEEFNPRCDPPWSARELRHKIESAAKQGRLEAGYLLEAGRP